MANNTRHWWTAWNLMHTMSSYETLHYLESTIMCDLNKPLKPSLFDKRVGQGKTSQHDAEYAISEQMNDYPLSEGPICLELSACLEKKCVCLTGIPFQFVHWQQQ